MPTPRPQRTLYLFIFIAACLLRQVNLLFQDIYFTPFYVDALAAHEGVECGLSDDNFSASRALDSSLPGTRTGASLYADFVNRSLTHTRHAGFIVMGGMMGVEDGVARRAADGIILALICFTSDEPFLFGRSPATGSNAACLPRFHAGKKPRAGQPRGQYHQRSTAARYRRREARRARGDA